MAKIKFYILLFIPIVFLISSYKINDEINMGAKYLSPFKSLYMLTLDTDKADEVRLSRKEMKYIKNKFRKNDHIIVNIDDKKYTQIILSLIDKSVLSKKPSSYHFLGTDHLGRDLFGMLLVASRNNFILSIITVFFSLTVGIIIGILQGYVLNRDTARFFQIIRSGIRFIVSCITSIPMIVWLLIIVLFNEIIIDVQDEFLKTMWTFILMGSIYYSSILSEAVEEHIIAINELEFLSASELMGLSKWRIIYYHIIKTNLGIVLFSQALLIVIQTILVEITISFSYINFGLSSVDSYGTLISQMFQNPGSMNMIYPVIFAGIICSIYNWTIQSFNQMRLG